MHTVCVFCGARPGRRPVFTALARETGRLLAEEGLELVTGGGRTGMMGAVADAALAAGGRVVGVIPRHLVARELAHEGLSELHQVDSMHARKERMHALSDAFVTLPGGMGSLDEVFEALTWGQLGLHSKPVAFVDAEGYWSPVLAQLDRAVEEGFLGPEQRGRILVAESPGELLAVLRDWSPVPPLRG